MKKLNTVNLVLKIVLIVFIALNIITYFMPFYRQIYESSYSQDNSTTKVYLYSGYLSVSPFTSLTLIIPIMAIVFLLTNFKSSKGIAFGLTASQIMTNIVFLLSISNLLDNNSNINYTYKPLYGYNVCIAFTILLSLALVATITVFIVSKQISKRQQLMQLNNENTSDNVLSPIDIFKKRIKTLEELKQIGVLTENEYEQKRNEIVQEFKI